MPLAIDSMDYPVLLSFLAESKDVVECISNHNSFDTILGSRLLTIYGNDKHIMEKGYYQNWKIQNGKIYVVDKWKRVDSIMVFKDGHYMGNALIDD
ncbi:MAG: hypothetical protein JKY42_09115, partial [Flavobacteriales bacterium]|nr:hypothetical protein [Flavobacteriales bacterium]